MRYQTQTQIKRLAELISRPPQQPKPANPKKGSQR
jgi:hypothetical protein